MSVGVLGQRAHSHDDYSLVAHGHAADYAALAHGHAAGTGDRWTERVKAAHQDVVGVTAFPGVNDDTLFLDVAAGEIWDYEIFLIYSGDVAGTDYSCRPLTPAGIWNLIRYHGITTADGQLAPSGALMFNASFDTGTQIDLGTGAGLGVTRPFWLQGMVYAPIAGRIQWQFKNVVAGTSRTVAGSFIRYRRRQ